MTAITEFKQTKIGPIPVDWDLTLVGNMAAVTSGGTPSTSKAEYWNPGEIPWLSSGEVHKKYVNYTDRYISKLGLDNSSAKLVPSQTVLIALAGQGKTRGTVAITEIELTTNQSIGAILPCDNIYPYFLYHNLNGRYSELRKMSTGDGGRGGLNLAIIKSIPIPLPPLPEQKKIAEVLSTFDDKIDSI
jgi:type I restriction enzyme S subunit